MSGLGLTLLHLYPVEMNLYGDTGNVLALSRRCEWRGIDLRVETLSPGGTARLADADLLFMGGGQDRGQEAVAQDLLSRGPEIVEAVEQDLPTLLVCGGYQLFGRHFDTIDGVRLPGIGVLDAVTVGARERLIGNVVVDASELAGDSPLGEGSETGAGPGMLVGFENHSGRTTLGERCRPLGRIVHGRGNDGTGRDEGAVYRNVFGTYLHGSLLPKNPWFADLLLSRALRRRYGDDAALVPLDDRAEYAAQRRGASRAEPSRVRRFLRR
jgi:lipid II isoglutaminyl synthase (glutamine-hydrolysing)